MSSFTLLFMATVHTRDHFIISRVQTVVLFPLLSARLLMNRFVYCSQQREDRIALNFKQMPWLKQLLFAPPSLRTMYFHLQFGTPSMSQLSYSWTLLALAILMYWLSKRPSRQWDCTTFGQNKTHAHHRVSIITIIIVGRHNSSNTRESWPWHYKDCRGNVVYNLWWFSTVCPYRVAVVLREKVPASARAVVI